MTRIVLFSNSAASIINYRGPLVHAFIHAGHEVIALAPGGTKNIIEQMQHMGVAYEPIEMEPLGMNPYKDALLVGRLTQIFRRLQPDNVLNCTIKPVIYGSWAAALAKVPHIASMITGLGHVFTNPTRKNQILQHLVVGLYRYSILTNQVIFFQNTDDRALFEARHLIPSHCQVIVTNGSGVDLNHFRPCTLHVSQPVFLLVARLLKDKGIHEYVSAAQKLKLRYPQCRFGLLGPIEHHTRAYSSEQIMHWHQTGLIEYLGVTEDVRHYLAQANVVVLPSKYREGVPRSLLEAMAMGRPVITTDMPGCRETVIDGVNGFLVPPGNTDALYHAMEKLILNPALLHGMGEKSRQLACQKFDVHQVNAAIMSGMGLHACPQEYSVSVFG